MGKKKEKYKCTQEELEKRKQITTKLNDIKSCVYDLLLKLDQECVRALEPEINNCIKSHAELNESVYDISTKIFIRINTFMYKTRKRLDFYNKLEKMGKGDSIVLGENHLLHYEKKYINEENEEKLEEIILIVTERNKTMYVSSYVETSNLFKNYKIFVRNTERDYINGKITFDEFINKVNMFKNV